MKKTVELIPLSEDAVFGIPAAWLEWDIRFAPLKTHPRYITLLEKMNLPLPQD